MSAINKTICPKCHFALNTQLVELDNIIRQAYGITTLDEYQKLLSKQSTLLDTRLELTLSEDYQIGVSSNTGNLTIFYTCHCSKCDFEYRFNHIENIL